jgi:formylglycine-generating enzyme required for sulfatase activity
MNKFVVHTLFGILLLSGAISACAPTTKAVTPTSASTPTDAMILIPAGEFTMGDSVEQAMVECKKERDDCESAWFAAEAPAHTVNLPAFYIDPYEVTTGNYKRCVDAGTCTAPRLTASATHPNYYGTAEFDHYPVINVNWGQAKTYCEWHAARLPSEAEWEKAARGTDQRTFPWGEGADKTRANYQASGFGDPIAVGSYETGKSPYGVYDMAGNVWEWVSDWYDVYPGGDPQANPDFGQKLRGLRGGAWLDPGNSIRASYRGQLDPTHDFGNIGFRCARDAK